MTVQALILALAHRIGDKTPQSQAFNGNDAAVVITDVTNDTPITIVAPGLVLSDGDYVHVKNVSINTAANNTLANRAWQVTRVSADQYQLDGSSGNGDWGGGSDAAATPALIGTVDGRQRTSIELLRDYSEARIVLARELMMAGVQPPNIGALVKSGSITFASGIATKPTDYLGFIAISNGIELADPEWRGVIRKGDNPDFVESLTNRFIFEEGTTFKHLGGFIANGVQTLDYYGLTEYTLSDVIDGFTVEQIPILYQGELLQIAELISRGAGAMEASALANKLLKLKAA